MPLHDETYQARVAALSLAQCRSVVSLLHSHGQHDHADRMEAALGAFAAIVSQELGRDALARALKWVAEEIGESSGLAHFSSTTH